MLQLCPTASTAGASPGLPGAGSSPLQVQGVLEGAEGSSLLSRPSGQSLYKRPLLQTDLNCCFPGVSQLACNPIS